MVSAVVHAPNGVSQVLTMNQIGSDLESYLQKKLMPLRYTWTLEVQMERCVWAWEIKLVMKSRFVQGEGEVVSSVNEDLKHFQPVQ